VRARAWSEQEHVGNAGHDAKTLHDRGLDRLAIAAVCWMERKDTRRSAGAQVLEDSALNCSLGTSAAAAHGTPFGTGFACGKR